MDSHEKPSEQELRQSRWTAYALGQLDGDELAEVEREMAEDTDATRFVDEIRTLAEHVRAARADEPLPVTSDTLQQRIVESIKEKEIPMRESCHFEPSERAERRRRRRSLFATAAASFVAGGILVGLLLPAILPEGGWGLARRCPSQSTPRIDHARTPVTQPTKANQTSLTGPEASKKKQGKTDELTKKQIDDLCKAIALRAGPGGTRNTGITPSADFSTETLFEDNSDSVYLFNNKVTLSNGQPDGQRFRLGMNDAHGLASPNQTFFLPTYPNPTGLPTDGRDSMKMVFDDASSGQPSTLSQKTATVNLPPGAKLVPQSLGTQSIEYGPSPGTTSQNNAGPTGTVAKGTQDMLWFNGPRTAIQNNKGKTPSTVSPVGDVVISGQQIKGKAPIKVVKWDLGGRLYAHRVTREGQQPVNEFFEDGYTDADMLYSQTHTRINRGIERRQYLRRQRELLNSLNAVESSNIAVNDNEPVCYPPVEWWNEMAQRRAKQKITTRLNSLCLAENWHVDQRKRIVKPNTEQYAPIIENRFVAPYDAPLSTFAVDVDTASYANVRRFLDNGQLPPPAAVRVEELVNYFSYDYPRPKGDEPFSVNFELADCPWRAGHQLLRIGLAGRPIEREKRGISNLVFLLDVSGSMADSNKLSLVKKAMRLLVDRLGENDRVAIVTYADTAAVRLESTNGQNKKAILAAIDALKANGSTNGSGGIELAYREAAKNFQSEGNNRIILATDGDLNVGVTKDDELVKLIKEKAASGVFLSVLGFGTGNLKDAKLEGLADNGNGNYAYVDNLREARKVLVEEMTGSLLTIAKDVKIQIEFNPARVAAYRLIGYENRKMAARDFNNDKKDAGEIGAGHTVTALYEIVPTKNSDDKTDLANTEPTLKYQKVVRPVSMLTEAANTDELATVRLRYKKPDGDKSQLIERAVRSSGSSFAGSSPDFQFASAVASFGMILRGSRYAGSATLAAVEEYATPGLSNDKGGHRAEFVDLVRKAKQLKGKTQDADKSTVVEPAVPVTTEKQ